MSDHDQQLVAMIDTAVGGAIEKHVNGKIRTLHSEFTEYVAEDKKWKDKVDPIIESIPDLTSIAQGFKAFKLFGSGAKYLSGVVAAVAVIGGVLVATIKFLIK